MLCDCLPALDHLADSGMRYTATSEQFHSKQAARTVSRYREAS
jgi:hypothetical protein